MLCVRKVIELLVNSFVNVHSTLLHLDAPLQYCASNWHASVIYILITYRQGI